MSSAVGASGEYDEEQVRTERAYNNSSDEPKDGKEMYNEEEYLAEVGELNCYCVPSRVYGFKDFFFRTLAWFLLNKEQIIGGFTGESNSVYPSLILYLQCDNCIAYI